MIGRMVLLAAASPAVAVLGNASDDVETVSTSPVARAAQAAAAHQKLVEMAPYGIPIVSMGMSVLAVFLVRQVVGQRDGRAKGDNYLTVLLMMLMAGINLTWLLNPMVAMAYGIGIGASGFALVELFRGKVLDTAGAAWDAVKSGIVAAIAAWFKSNGGGQTPPPQDPPAA